MIIKNSNKSEVPGNLRDPAVIDYDGKYYLVATSANFWSGYTPGVKLWSSDDLVNWKYESTIISAEEIPEGCHCKNRFWAPELFIYNGKFYCTVNGKDDEAGVDLNSYIAVADNILGPYKLNPEPIIDRNTNDVSLFLDDDGKVYATASWGDILLWEMDMETCKAKTAPRSIGSPGKEGEWDHGGFIEGSYMVKRGGVYYVWYSGVGRGYEMGWLVSDDINGEFKKYSDGPVLSGLDTDLPISGHNACFKLRDGRDAVSFHGHKPGEPELLCFDIVTYPMEPRKISMEIEG